MNRLKKILSLIIIFLVFCPLVASATGVYSNLNTTAAGTGLEKNTDLITFVGRVIGVVLVLLGAALVVVLIYAGILWGFIAQGDKAQIDKAKKMIINSIIGLAIVFSAYAIATFILSNLDKAVK